MHRYIGTIVKAKLTFHTSHVNEKLRLFFFRKTKNRSKRYPEVDFSSAMPVGEGNEQGCKFPTTNIYEDLPVNKKI